MKNLRVKVLCSFVLLGLLFTTSCKSKSGYGCDYGFGSIEKPVEKHKSTAPSAKTFTVISKDATIAD